ncbi:large subunit ribosomal protein L29 [Maridesulfovibrio ferrireducens]|uniref:Large ribosomal subunit protein uL29 n=1 Tax=Maridesulfovibrio ferrireducens TaxID=246191 RepID=A0A1G9F6S7_9BACT|nr:50S ribosomal protein L29 [Maridesulfovibrio ferrireducens]SDK84082.1 large subunit ribosomal protein L29 [Maridesulfovibrio ferrireducens]
MKTKELRELDTAALTEKLTASRLELFNLRFKHATAQLENTQRLVEVKKDIAKIQTLQREKELGA